MCFQLSEADSEGDDLDNMTAVQLKALCKEHGLKVSGRKAELQDRLRQHFLSTGQLDVQEEDDFDKMSDEDLRNSLAVRDLDTSGSRDDLLERIRADTKFMAELSVATSGYKSISEALQAAANNGGATSEILESIKANSKEEPKFIDVTIRSLGMQPEQFTAGGAPSVTADVLRKLAGDPYENPPKYGSVSL